MKTCKLCGTLFSPEKIGQIYCTKSCEREKRRLERESKREVKIVNGMRIFPIVQKGEYTKELREWRSKNATLL